MHDIIIIGGGTAGLTAAIYARRAGKSVLIIEKSGFGGQITSSPKIDNYPGMSGISGTEFASLLTEQALSLGAEAELESVLEIQNFDRPEKTVVTDYGRRECKAVIIASGATHRKLGVEREDELSGKGVSYCAVCDGAFFAGQPVAVAGGGSAALQEALFLSATCSKVYLIHRRDSFRGEAALSGELAQKPNVELVMSSRVTALHGNSCLTGITVENIATAEKSTLPVEALFVSVGHVAANEPFRPIAALDEQGFILTDENCAVTANANSAPQGIYAAGDCRSKQIRQLTTAASDGTIAALSALRYLEQNV